MNERNDVSWYRQGKPAMSPKEELHQLVEAMPEAEVEHARRLLAGLCGKDTKDKASSRPAPSCRRSIEKLAAQLAAEVPAEEWKSLPEDLIDNLDHYIYGTPKR
jgi:hypothetical protein